jgi:hypothetical protein
MHPEIVNPSVVLHIVAIRKLTDDLLQGKRSPSADDAKLRVQYVKTAGDWCREMYERVFLDASEY